MYCNEIFDARVLDLMSKKCQVSRNKIEFSEFEFYYNLILTSLHFDITFCSVINLFGSIVIILYKKKLYNAEYFIIQCYIIFR